MEFHGWDTSHPATISKKIIILIYHYLHAVYESTGSNGRHRSVGPVRCINEIAKHIEIDDETPRVRR